MNSQIYTWLFELMAEVKQKGSKSMKKPLTVSVLMTIAAQWGLSQTPNPFIFFPHHQGDIWEYVDPMNPNNYVQNIITIDSVGADGRYYVVTTMFGPMRLDTTTFEVHGQRWAGAPFENLIYSLSADSGEAWVVQRNEFRTLLGTVVDAYETYIFGNVLVTMKEIDYTDSASGLLFDTDYLASDFGLVGQDVDAFPVWRIRGSLINGVQHGTITSVNEDGQSCSQVSSFQLHQNYPNPFNPYTTIEYEVGQRGLVLLRIFDLIGREVGTLAEAVHEPGRYAVRFDGTRLASGVYLCRIETGRGAQTRRMILLK